MGGFPLVGDRAVHSDFLVHWTGKDIDAEIEPDWYEKEDRSKTSPAAAEKYIKRLKDILAYGLWMTEGEPEKFKIGENEIEIPIAAKCCFTELKLSESRRHAVQYGRLGIGVKRPFVFNRLGRPVSYVGYAGDRNRDKFLEACTTDLQEKWLLNFFKPMNSDSRRLVYEFYAESEWRVVFCDDHLSGKIVDPRDSTNVREHAYFNSLSSDEQSKLKYLMPLDGWFSLVIYPSLNVKNHAQWEGDGIRTEIERIKKLDDVGNRVEGLHNPTRGNWPIEVNLDACAHF